MRFLLAILTVFSFALAHHEPTQAVMDAQLSFVHIVGESPDGVLFRTCSGAVLDGAIYTAGHCITTKPNSFALYVEDVLGNLYPATVRDFGFNGGNVDWAILDSEAARVLPSLERAEKPPNVGDTVYAWSGPNGFDALLFRGMVAGRIFNPDDHTLDGMLYADIDNTKGSSGSLVLNEQGEVVGILSIAFVSFPMAISPLSGAGITELP